MPVTHRSRRARHIAPMDKTRHDARMDAQLGKGRGLLDRGAHWWMSTMPGLAIFVAVMGFNLLGDVLRDALDVWDQ